MIREMPVGGQKGGDSLVPLTCASLSQPIVPCLPPLGPTLQLQPTYVTCKGLQVTERTQSLHQQKVGAQFWFCLWDSERTPPLGCGPCRQDLGPQRSSHRLATNTASKHSAWRPMSCHPQSGYVPPMAPRWQQTLSRVA